jgi:hypothetical protein
MPGASPMGKQKDFPHGGNKTVGFDDDFRDNGLEEELSSRCSSLHNEMEEQQ